MFASETDNPRYSVVVPFHNEQDSVAELHRQLCEVLDGRYEPAEQGPLVAVSGPGGMKLYMNGVLVGSDPFEGSFASVKNEDHIRLGRD